MLLEYYRIQTEVVEYKLKTIRYNRKFIQYKCERSDIAAFDMP